MLRSLKDLTHHKVKARDGNMESVQDFYFDDTNWAVRYMVVDTGSWFRERPVLIGPSMIRTADGERGVIRLAMSKEEIEKSPKAEEDKPASEVLQELARRHVDTPVYIMPPLPVGSMVSLRHHPGVSSKDAQIVEKEAHGWLPRLRSVDEVTGYHIIARDGEVGRVDDLICDDDLWMIRYLAVAARNDSGKKFLLSPRWLDEIKWSDRSVHVDLERATIENGPEYDPREPVNRRYEETLYDYYGRPSYWS